MPLLAACALCTCALARNSAPHVLNVQAEDYSRISENLEDDKSSWASLFFADATADTHNTCMPWAVPAGDRCAYVMNHTKICGEGKGIVPYLRIHYCMLANWPLLSNMIMLSWIFFLLALLKVVADRFFCPALEVIADFFKLPANVAGATLLAFGNGAPDMFTQLAAVSAFDASAVPMAIGEPLGGGLFVSNVVLAAVVFMCGSGPHVQVEKRAFLRDAGFYAGAVCLLIGICVDGKIHLLESLSLCVYYALFVVYIVVFDRHKADALHIEESLHYQQVYHQLQQQASLPTPPERATITVLTQNAPRLRSQLLLGPPLDRAVPAADGAPQRTSTPGGLECHTRSITLHGQRAAEAVKFYSFFEGQHAHSMPRVRNLDSLHASPSEPLLPAGSGGTAVDAPLRAATWGDYAQLPLVWIVRLTMPEVGVDDNVSYPKPFACVLPVTAPLFVVLCKGLALQNTSPLDADALLYGLTCSAFSSAVIWSIYPASGRHYGILSAVFTAMTFAMSVLWMNVAVGEMLWTCKSLGFIHGLSQNMLGVTVLAWGNSYGDLVANMSMARDGFPSMAVAACFASPLFTMAAGLGVSLSIAAAQSGTLAFGVSAPMRLVCAFAGASILRFLVTVPLLHGWRLTRGFACFCIGFYVVFQAFYLWLIA